MGLKTSSLSEETLMKGSEIYEITSDDDGNDSSVECLGLRSSTFMDNGKFNETEEETNSPIYDFSKIACSVDFGEYGFAYCTGIPNSKPPMILGMGVESIGPVLTARDASIAIARVFQWFTGMGSYVMEEQPAINRKTCMMEAAFSGMALASVGTGANNVVHVPPSSVSTMFSLPKGNRAKKKQAAVDVAWALLGNKKRARGRMVPSGVKVAFSDQDSVVSLFTDTGRCHDMADALLQFVWYSYHSTPKYLQCCTTPFGTNSLRPLTPRDLKRERFLVEKRVAKGKKLMMKHARNTKIKRKRGAKSTTIVRSVPNKRPKHFRLTTSS